MPTLALLVLALSAPVLGACGGEDERVRGWPRPGYELPPPPVPPEDDVAPIPPPRPDAGASAATEAEPDISSGPNLDVSEASPPCVALVDRACEMLGQFSEECAQARARRPQERPLEAQELCAEILTTFEDGEGKARPTLACWRVAKARCKVLGKKSRPCVESKAAWKTLRKRAQRKACQGDILLFRAREALPPKR